jgi:two-component system clock-associated histidine kinase SasA
LNVSLTSANSLLSLVESILDVNKLAMGELPLVVEPLDLGRVARSAVQTLSQNAHDADITLTLDAPLELPTIKADREKIERVLINLLDNALRYTPQGGAIRLTLTAKPQFIQVAVSDTGPGIPPDQRERIFERFVQVNTSQRKRGSKGSGMGLTFCKLAVEAHGGQIWVEESPEGGAAFHFTLPTEMSPVMASETAS